MGALLWAAFLLRNGAGAPAPAAAPAASPTPPGPSPSGAGSLRTDLTVRSRLLGRDVPYSLYLPARAGTAPTEGGRPDAGIPVLFLLHGTSGSHTDWAVKGGIVPTVERAVAAGRIPACALVMPDARRDPTRPGGGQDETFYINDLAAAAGAGGGGPPRARAPARGWGAPPPGGAGGGGGPGGSRAAPPHVRAGDDAAARDIG
ncbi:hypothetical protein ACFVG7_38640, partial [Streptomyces sp. NPDC127112]